MYVAAGAGAYAMSGVAVGAALAYNYIGGDFSGSSPGVVEYKAGPSGTQQTSVKGAESSSASA